MFQSFFIPWSNNNNNNNKQQYFICVLMVLHYVCYNIDETLVLKIKMVDNPNSALSIYSYFYSIYV